MKPARFRYHAPKTIEEAVDTLAEVAGEDGRVLAGGQSLVPIMAFRLARPAHLVDINGVAALRRLAVDGGRLSIGACVRHAAFHKPVVDGPLGRLLATVVRHIAHHPIRTRGTFCGSIAHADPASEWCAVATALDADMVAESKVSGSRVIAARSFFEGIMTTALHDGELLREVRLPILPRGTWPARPSIRWTTRASAPNTAATWCVPWSSGRWRTQAHENLRPMNEQSGATKWIGQSVERLEDPPLVTGRGRFAGDINFPRQLHMRIVRSNHAHANIVSIDTEAARELPGVVAVWTAADITDVPPIDFREGPIEKLAPYRQPVLAVDTVRYVGEPVAAVFAEDPYVAEGAADLVTMEVEGLPPLLDARDDPGEFSFGRDTEADILTQGYGDVEAVFKSAAHIVELKLTSGRHSGVPLECRGALGRYDASRDVLELHGAAKVPHRNKELIARMLSRAPASVQCLESHVGGGFGIRG